MPCDGILIVIAVTAIDVLFVKLVISHRETHDSLTLRNDGVIFRIGHFRVLFPVDQIVELVEGEES